MGKTPPPPFVDSEGTSVVFKDKTIQNPTEIQGQAPAQTKDARDGENYSFPSFETSVFPHAKNFLK